MNKITLISIIILLLVSTNLFAQELPDEVYEIANKYHRDHALTFVSRDTLKTMLRTDDWSYYRQGDPYFSYALHTHQCKNIKTAPGVLNIAFIECVYFPVIVGEEYVQDRGFKYYEEHGKWLYSGGPTSSSYLSGTIDHKGIKCIDDISLVRVVDHKFWFLMIECNNKFYVRTLGDYHEMFGIEVDDWAYNPLVPFEKAWPIILDSFPKKPHEVKKKR